MTHGRGAMTSVHEREKHRQGENKVRIAASTTCRKCLFCAKDTLVIRENCKIKLRRVKEICCVNQVLLGMFKAWSHQQEMQASCRM